MKLLLQLLGLMVAASAMTTISAFSPRPTFFVPPTETTRTRSRTTSLQVSLHSNNQESTPIKLIKNNINNQHDPPSNNNNNHRIPLRHTHVCPQTGVTLSRYMMELERWNPPLMGEIESIFTSIQVGCKAISNLVRKAPLQSNLGYHAAGDGNSASINIQGEQQTKLDVLANDVLKNALQWAGHFKTMASEEDELPMVVQGSLDPEGIFPEALMTGQSSYIAVFDPLDGSANLDSGIPVGTIFGIFRHSDEAIGNKNSKVSLEEDVLQPGRNLVAAGYCLYSSATTLVMTVGQGTHGFTLDETIGEFVLTHPHIQIPKRGAIYSFNEGNRWEWDQPIQEYILDLQTGTGETGTKYKGRYVGSMVADVHRTLMYGGIFGYPADRTSLNGKLRLLYEAAPMAFLVEQAGGQATTGTRPIRDVLPTDVHARVPVILGSPEDVEELKSYYTAAAEELNNNNMTTANGLHYA